MSLIAKKESLKFEPGEVLFLISTRIKDRIFTEYMTWHYVGRSKIFSAAILHSMPLGYVLPAVSPF